MMRVGVLASGSGTNFQSLVDTLNVPGSPATIYALGCNVEGAKVIDRAKAAGIAAELLPWAKGGDRAAYDAKLADALESYGVELVCLAGYMRLLTPVFLSRFPGRVLNVHPALLPSFPGLHAPQQALDQGVRIAGCTVHFVDEGTDTGPIIAQAAVEVRPTDDLASLTARIQKEEHRLYPKVVRAIATGRVRLSGRKVLLEEPIE